MPKGVADWLAKNMWAILALIGGGMQGYNVGTNTMAAMKADVEAMKAREQRRRPFVACLIRRVDRLEDGIKGPSPCNEPFPD
jgi:hypothetical protein